MSVLPVQQWWVLTLRQIAPSVRNGEVVTAIITPVVFTAGFYIPLNLVMSFPPNDPVHGMSSFAQFLMPMIVLQALAFTAISAAFRAATDAVEGINKRFGSMPIAVGVPLAARMGANMYRCVISIASAVACGYVIGFRFYLDALHTIGFLLFAFGIGTALSLGADLIGTLSASPEATTQSLALPQLILGMLSAGFLPAASFPSWIQGFVRNQPISQFAYGLRALAGDSTPGAGVANWATMGPPLLWVFGLLVVLGPIAIAVTARRP